MSQLAEILARIDQARHLSDGKPLSHQAISNLATGKPKSDLIRNWRRAVNEGRETSARLDTLAAVAEVLGVSKEWLATGSGSMQAITDVEQQILNELRRVPESRRAEAARAALATVRLAQQPPHEAA